MIELNEDQKRHFMELSINIMKDSIQERRHDKKPSPLVGAVLVRDDLTTVTACRGELREGDHAEYTLLERKCRSEKLDGFTLFSTLEPCAPGARSDGKLSCAERIVNARIGKVYIGIEDPDPKVCRKGIKFLIDSGVCVEMYPREFQPVIEDCNAPFLAAAHERAKLVDKEVPNEILLSQKEKAIDSANLNGLSLELMAGFMDAAHLGDFNTPEGKNSIQQLGYIETQLDEKGNTIYVPTGIGMLLFGKRPDLIYPHAVIRAIYKTKGMKEDIETISGPLVSQPELIYKWYESRLGRQIDRSGAQRKYVYSYPIEVINELVKNAILHRDYDIEGASIYLEINDDAIIIKSPGNAVPPIKFEQIASFTAPSLSRNPKIMYVFDSLRLAEQRGLGFTTVRDLPAKYGLPLPIVRFDDPYLVFILPRNANYVKSIDGLRAVLTEGEIKILDFFKLNAGRSFGKSDIADTMGITARTAERELGHLVELKLLVREGAGRSTVYQYAE